MAPQIIRPRSKYNIIVALNDITSETTINCNLVKSNNRSQRAISATETFDRINNFKVIDLQIGTEWSEGSYNLTITSSGEVSINHFQQVQFVYKQFVILVQSDKAIYKPGQDVLFRAVILDDLLKPVRLEDISDVKIFIKVSFNIKISA